MNGPPDDLMAPSPPPTACGDRRSRREKVRQKTNLFGVDFVEVEPEAPGDTGPRLRVGLLDESLPGRLVAGNFRFEGGRRVPGSTIRVVDVRECDPCDPTVPAAVLLTLNRRGDYSPYALRLVEDDPRRPGEPTEERLRGVDPVLDRANFSFPPPPDCDEGAELDCAPPAAATPAVPDPPGGPAAIDYLARDYESLRDLLLRRLGLLLPYWTDRHASDPILTVVEILAYAGDRLSYAQDAVTTEAYLRTARRRISVRRHAALIDYPISEGCAARAWVSLEVVGSFEVDLARLRFRTAADPTRPRGAADDGSLAFEPVRPAFGASKVTLRREHNQFQIYTWGDQICRLSRGATGATLRYVDEAAMAGAPGTEGDAGPGAADQDLGAGYVAVAAAGSEAGQGQGQAAQEPPSPVQGPPPAHVPSLPPAPRPGDVLIFVEVKGRRTGLPVDADPTRRHAVRLTEVIPRHDPTEPAAVLWDVAWDEADALPFPLTISCVVPRDDAGHYPSAGAGSVHCEPIPDVTVAYGNVLLVEHGATQPGEALTAPAAVPPDPTCPTLGPPSYPSPVVPPFRPRLVRGPLMHSEPFPRPDWIASRQGRALRAVRDWAAGVFVRARRHLRVAGAPIAESDPLGRQLLGLLDERARARCGFRFADSGPGAAPVAAQATGQYTALVRLEARPGRRFEEFGRRLDAIIDRLDHGQPLGRPDEAEFLEMLAPSFGGPSARETLEGRGLTWDSPRWLGPAAEALAPDPSRAVPVVELAELGADGRLPDTAERALWTPVRTLLSSRADDRHFVAEIDDDGRARLRFGQPAPVGSAFGDADALGRAPTPGQRFVAIYRAGQGTVGNIAAGALTRAFKLEFDPAKPTKAAEERPLAPSAVAAIRQPLPAHGGTDPETLARGRRVAPGTIRGRMERAITPEDYARLAERHPGVARAAAVAHSDGVGTLVVVAIDPAGRRDVPPVLLEQVRAFLESYRRLGHAVDVVPARFVALRLDLEYRVAAGAQAGHVREALLDVFSSGATARRPGGLGYFHPDLWSFGRSVAVSDLLAEALAVPGVRDASVSKLLRIDPPGGESERARVNRDGVLPIGPLEIARLENDPSLPERGRIRLVLADDRPAVCHLKGSEPRTGSAP